MRWMLALTIVLYVSSPALAGEIAVEVLTVGADGNEKPVAGARVAVAQADAPVFAETVLSASEHETDARGRVAVPRGAGPVLVLAGIPGRGTAFERVDPASGEVTLVLPAEAVLTARVVDPDGKGVGGAEVLLAPERPEDTGAFLAAGAPVFRGTTDGAGEVVFYRLAADARYRVRARAPGLARTVQRDLHPGEEPIEIPLARGATVRGSLSAIPGGEPVVGALVSLGDASARSGAKGEFELTGVPAGSHRLRIRAAGHLHEEDADLVLADGDVREGLLVRLLGSGRMTGRVLAPTTLPAAGAEIFLRYPGNPEFADRLPPDRTVRAGMTDERGRFDVKGLVPAQGVDLIARHPDFAPAAYRGYSILAAQTVETIVLLRKGGVLAGRAIDGDGEPVAKVRVLVFDEREDLSALLAGRELFSPLMREAVTGEDGAYTVAGLSGGRKAVVALKEGLLPYVVRGVEVAEGEKREGMTLFLGAGARVSGRVLTGEERPIPEARVALVPPLGSPRETIADEDGAFALDGVPAGPYSLEVTADGYAPFLVEVTAPATDLEVRLGRGGGLGGSVLEEDSREAVPGATVRALLRGAPSELDPDRPVYREVVRVRASPSGSFLLGDLPEGAYRLEAWSEDGMFGYMDRLAVGAGADPEKLTLRVYAGWALTGRVVRAVDGLPVEGATVALRGVGDDPGPHSAVCDGYGEFRIGGVPPGFHTLVVVARDLAPGMVTSVEVRRAADTRVPDIELTSGGALRGLVIGPDGNPRAGAEVRLASAELKGERRTLTDGAGGFQFTHVTAGTYLLVTEDPGAGGGGQRFERLVEISEGDDLLVAIGSGGGTALTGTITSGGSPVAYALVSALRVTADLVRDRRVVTTRTDAEGNYVFPDLAPGDLLVLVSPQGSTLAPVRIPVRVQPGPVMIQDLVLPDSGIEGLVTDQDTGRALPGVTLYLTREAGGAEGTFLEALTRDAGAVKSDPDGRFLFAAVPPGEYRLEAFLSGYGQTRSRPIRVTPGGFSTALLDMPPAGVLSGRVLTDEGRPVSDARVTFLDARGRIATEEAFLEVDSAGTFRAESLRTGRYVVEVRAPGHALARKVDVEVFPGGEPELEFRLAPEGRLEITVYGAGGVPLEGARVELTDFWGDEVPIPPPPVGLRTPYRDPAVSDAEGRVLLRNLPAGIYVATARLAGHAGGPARVRVLDGEITRGAIVLLPKGLGR